MMGSFCGKVGVLAFNSSDRNTAHDMVSSANTAIGLDLPLFGFNGFDHAMLTV